MKQNTEITNSNAAAAEQLDASATNLNQRAIDLKQIVEHFQLENQGHK